MRHCFSWARRRAAALALLCVSLVLGLSVAIADQSNLWSPTTGTVSGLNLTNNYNSALNALATCNSGSSAPSNPLSAAAVAGQCWYNTTTGALQTYDGTNWLTLGYLDTTNHIWTPVVGGGAATNVASAATANLCGSSGAAPIQAYLTITGTTTITSFGGNCVTGQVKFLTFSGSLTLTYNASSLILPTAASIVTAAGDTAIAVSLGSSNWKIIAYLTASGQPLASNLIPWSIAGGLPSSITGSTTTATMTISALTAADATGLAIISWTGNKSWAVSNGNAINGSADGTTLTSSATYHMYACQGASGSGSFASRTAPASFLASSCPSGYTTYARRIFSFNTGATTTGPLPYTAREQGGGAIRAILGTRVVDQSSTLPTSPRSLVAVGSVPTGVIFEWLGEFILPNSGVGSNYFGVITSPDEPDTAASSSNFDAAGGNISSATLFASFSGSKSTNTSAQVGVRGSSANNYDLNTIGWIDWRRSFLFILFCPVAANDNRRRRKGEKIAA